MPSLQERLDNFKRNFESGAPLFKAPPEIIATMHRATAELEASGAAKRALKIGDRAPEFTLFNQDHVASLRSKVPGNVQDQVCQPIGIGIDRAVRGGHNGQIRGDIPVVGIQG